MNLESLSRQQINGSRLLEVANDLLLFRKFDDVLKVCRLGTNSKQDVVFPNVVENPIAERVTEPNHNGPEQRISADTVQANGLKHNFVDINPNDMNDAIKRFVHVFGWSN